MKIEKEISKETITSDDVLGKDVVDRSAKSIGVVMKLHIDKIDKFVSGISVDTGFMKPMVFVGADLIHHFGIDAVYIERTPGVSYVGKKVFDKTGAFIGYLKSVDQNISNGKIKSIIVRRRFRKFKIPSSSIKHMDKNIILSIDKAEVISN